VKLLAFILCTLPLAAQLSQTFSETGYSDGTDLPVYSAPNQPAWLHVGCDTSGNCMFSDQGRVEDQVTSATHHGAY